MLKRNQGLLATLIASLIILAVVVTGCGGGGGTKPPPVDRQIDIARFVRLIGDQKVAVSDLHVVWTINGQTTISQTRSDGVLAITVRQQGAFRVSLSSPDSPAAFDPQVIDVPAGGMATPREVQLLTEITVTRSFGDLPPIDWEANIAVRLYIIEPDGTVIAPASEPKAVATPTEDDPIKDGGCALTYDKIANDENGESFIRFLVNRPGKANVTAYASDRLTEAIRGIVTIVDNQPPEIKNVVPANGTTVKDVVDINCRVEDNYAVKNVVITANGKTLTTRQESRGQQIFHASWDTTEEADGAAQLTFQAWDAVGIESSVTTVNVTVKNPWVLPAPTANLTLSREPDIDVKSIPGLEDADFCGIETYAIGPDGTQWLNADHSLVLLDANNNLVGNYDAPIYEGMPNQIEFGPADVDEQGRLVIAGFWGIYRVSLPGPVFETFAPPPGVSNIQDIFVDRSVIPSRTFICYGFWTIEVKLQGNKAVEVNRWEVASGHIVTDCAQDVFFTDPSLTATRISTGEMKEYNLLAYLGMAKATNNCILTTSPYTLGGPNFWLLISYDGVIRSSLNGYVGGEMACHPDIQGKIRTVYNNYKVDGFRKPKIAVIDLVSQ